MRVGVLTGGGDCPGLNAVIRAVVRKGVQEYGYEFVGFRDGWRGPLDGDVTRLDIPAVRGTLPRGGTILGSSRLDPLQRENGPALIRENLAKHEVEALIVVGGSRTLGAAARLADDHGLPIVGVPKTIDNDLSATDYTFGFDTAVGIATEAIDRLHTTAESHMRVLVVEVMGRSTGWIALHSGLAGGANVILIPEQRFDVDQVCAWVTSRFRASYAPIVVVAEGALPKDDTTLLTEISPDPSGRGRSP
jgi:6-phosphofructokinase 1